MKEGRTYYASLLVAGTIASIATYFAFGPGEVFFAAGSFAIGRQFVLGICFAAAFAGGVTLLARVEIVRSRLVSDRFNPTELLFMLGSPLIFFVPALVTPGTSVLRAAGMGLAGGIGVSVAVAFVGFDEPANSSS